ncbi:uncharacterized protein T551_02122 [Pneumocystis jirovecii RU7]|uniref:Uncharacterized protein n=1 Tax=Pneumocystis jirovecii (strain RU7) TaxID=1408657 RepID=A0A0W4ZMA4_PNEJ7|nr:uncharacterized protein T551_02122 [Pneumocystis jirovecii RU7]KTW29506.1 hypothetical protein T551_02122 [Pneumocystis jirovecii RU7]
MKYINEKSPLKGEKKVNYPKSVLFKFPLVICIVEYDEINKVFNIIRHDARKYKENAALNKKDCNKKMNA